MKILLFFLFKDIEKNGKMKYNVRGCIKEFKNKKGRFLSE